MNANAIEIDSLCKSIGNSYLIENLSFNIPAGQTVLLLGHNGAGKSTLLKILAGLLSPSKGVLRNEAAGTVYQGHELGLYDELTVVENLDFFLNAEQGLLDRVLRTWNLAECSARAISQCSKGEKQRTSLACSLYQPADLFLMDEPTTGLDKESVAALTDCISSYADKTFVIASHDFTSFSEIADRLIILRAGKVVYDALLESVPAVERAVHTSTVYLEFRV